VVPAWGAKPLLRVDSARRSEQIADYVVERTKGRMSGCPVACLLAADRTSGVDKVSEILSKSSGGRRVAFDDGEMLRNCDIVL
jgi:hypothetical protein